MNTAELLVGIAFGFLLVASRVSDPDVIHRMLLLQEADVFLLIGSAILTAASLLIIMKRLQWRTAAAGPLVIHRAPVERKNIFGAVLFGAGWAVAGTCPGPALAMTVGGNILGLVVMAGLAAGVFLRDKVSARPASLPIPNPGFPR